MMWLKQSVSELRQRVGRNVILRKLWDIEGNGAKEHKMRHIESPSGVYQCGVVSNCTSLLDQMIISALGSGKD